jgi:hypothetical protein
MRYVFLMILVMCNSCSQLAEPHPFGIFRGMVDGAPAGSNIFRSGWKDGCESGMAAYGGYHYKATHGYRYNVQMLDSDEYHTAWRIGFRHCRWYTAEWERQK